jgi:DHA1 family multidrug resistance protein-like MFS transporter
MTSDPPASTAFPPWRRTLYIMLFAQTITSIGFSSFFPFLPLYVKSLGAVSGLSIELLAGLVFSGQAFMMMIASPFWGALADRRGRKLMVERAMFGGAVILALMAFVRSAEELVLLRALQGLITGTIGAANALVAATVPRRHTGYAMGLMQVGMGAGVGLGPLIGGALADAYGYHAVFYVTGALLALAGVIVWLGVDEQFQAPPAKGGRNPGFWHDWQRVLAAPGVRMTYGLRFLNQMGRMIFIPILPLFLLGLLHDPGRINSFTGLVIGIASAAAATSAVFLGRLGDRLGHRAIVVASCLACGALFLLQSVTQRDWLFLVLQGFTGVALGGIVPGISVLLAQYTQCGQEGAVYGLDNSIVSGARAVAPLLGVAVAMAVGYRAVFAAAALLYLTAAALATWALPSPPECPAPPGPPPRPMQ